MYYLDNAATTRVADQVIEEIGYYMRDYYGNPGSIHDVGRTAAENVAIARRCVARVIHAEPDNIIFTSGGTEADNMAILGLEEYLRDNGKTHLITMQVEHPAVLRSMELMERRGFDVTYLPVDPYTGVLPLKVLENAMRDTTGLVSVMCVNNETGNLYPIREIGKLCHSHKVLFHTDCVQAYGNTPIDVKQDNIDFLSVSGHKLHAPKGIGFLYAKEKYLLNPLIVGGGQEDNLRSGTENVPGIAGLGVAAELFGNVAENVAEASKKRELFLEELSQSGVAYAINGTPHEGSKTINLQFHGVDGETLVLLLSTNGVCVSAGSACHAHNAEPSHVLKALGLTDEQARSSIRISFSLYDNEETLREAAGIIAKCVKQLKDST